MTLTTSMPREPGLAAVVPDVDQLAERCPHGVEVHVGSHRSHDHFEGAGACYLDLLKPRASVDSPLRSSRRTLDGHRLGQLARLGVDGCDPADVEGHCLPLRPPRHPEQTAVMRIAWTAPHAKRSAP